jgi:hypothetical protein
MQRLTIVRYATKPEASAENEQRSRKVFDHMRADAPDDVAYGLFRMGDEFIHLFVNLAADNSDAVTENPPFRAYQADLAARCATPPEVTRLSVELIDSYGLGNG